MPTTSQNFAGFVDIQAAHKIDWEVQSTEYHTASANSPSSGMAASAFPGRLCLMALGPRSAHYLAMICRGTHSSRPTSPPVPPPLPSFSHWGTRGRSQQGRFSAHPEQTETFGQHLSAPTSLRFAPCCSALGTKPQTRVAAWLPKIPQASPAVFSCAWKVWTCLSSDTRPCLLFCFQLPQTASPTPQIQLCWVRNKCALRWCSKQRGRQEHWPSHEGAAVAASATCLPHAALWGCLRPLLIPKPARKHPQGRISYTELEPERLKWEKSWRGWSNSTNQGRRKHLSTQELIEINLRASHWDPRGGNCRENWSCIGAT